MSLLDGSVAAVDEASGRKLWSYNTGSPLVSNKVLEACWRHQQAKYLISGHASIASELCFCCLLGATARQVPAYRPAYSRCPGILTTAGDERGAGWRAVHNTAGRRWQPVRFPARRPELRGALRGSK